MNDKHIFIRSKYMATMNKSDDILYDNTLVIKDNIIEFIGNDEEIAQRYGDISNEKMVYDMGLMLPGLVTPHTHLFQSLMKGIGVNFNLDDWVTKVIFPMSLAMGYDECYDAGMLNMAEMIRTGTTCFADSHYIVHKKETFEGMVDAVRDTGIRGILCRATQSMQYHPDVPIDFIETPEKALLETEDCIKKYHNTLNNRLKVGVEPITPIDCSQEVIKGLYDLAEKYDTLFQIHAAETFGELTLIKNTKNMGIMSYLDSLGVLSKRSMIIHGVWISAKEVQLLADRGSSVAHNPLANMILADGIAPIPELMSCGVPVGIGVDGAASNNNQDMVESMKVGALLHRVNKLDASVISAYDVLKMGTMGGARCLGLDKEIGSLEVGKKADVIIVDTNSIHMSPCVDPIANFVFSGNGRDVDTVIVDGKLLMKNKVFTELNLERIIENANKSASKMANEANVRKLCMI